MSAPTLHAAREGDRASRSACAWRVAVKGQARARRRREAHASRAADRSRGSAKARGGELEPLAEPMLAIVHRTREIRLNGAKNGRRHAVAIYTVQLAPKVSLL